MNENPTLHRLNEAPAMPVLKAQLTYLYEIFYKVCRRDKCDNDTVSLSKEADAILSTIASTIGDVLRRTPTERRNAVLQVAKQVYSDEKFKKRRDMFFGTTRKQLFRDRQLVHAASEPGTIPGSAPDEYIMLSEGVFVALDTTADRIAGTFDKSWETLRIKRFLAGQMPENYTFVDDGAILAAAEDIRAKLETV